MAEDIVACTGCGKKFRIPDGSPACGKFACTACGADVTWGPKRAGAAKAGVARTGGAARGARSGRPAKGARRSRGGGPEEKTSRGARRARGRRGRDDGAAPADEAGGGRRGRVPKEKENKTLPLIAALMGAVVLIGGLIIAFTRDPPDYAAQAAAASALNRAGARDEPATGVSNAGSVAATPSEDATGGDGAAPTTPVAPAPPTAEDEPEEESGIGGANTKQDRPKGYRYWYLRPLDELFTDIPPVEGTTDEEAARLRELAARATDYDEGAPGMAAYRDLVREGRKAVPFVLSQLQKAWNGAKWKEKSEQFSCARAQEIVREITKADGPPSDFRVRFPPGPGVEPTHYERAGRMWIAWWKGEGQYIEEFKAYEDEE